MNHFKEIDLITILLMETVTDTGEEIADDMIDNVDIEVMYRIILSQSIGLTIYPSLKNHGQVLFRECEVKLKNRYYTDLRQTIEQENEGKRILSVLDEAGIDHIALKGWVMKRLYPCSEYRGMADIDMLVKDYDYDRLSEVMDRCGYTGEGRSSWMHDNFRKDSINVEMHKRLTDDSGVIQSWERKMWDHARLVRGTKHEYEMCNDDYFIFHMIHMYKDFRDGHLGLRRLLDMWIILERYKDRLNEWYLDKAFAQMGMVEFVSSMKKLAYSCFETHVFDEDSAVLMEFCIESGIYGTERTYKVSRIARSSSRSSVAGKMISFVSAIFLPWDRMKAHFPILKKYPVLLPVMWAKRILGFAKHADKYVSKLNYNNISDSEYTKMKRVFKAGGVI